MFETVILCQAKKLGFDKVIWLDAACYAVNNPEKLFDNYINKEINRRKNITSIYDYVAKEKELSDSEKEEAEAEQEVEQEVEAELLEQVVEEIVEIKPQKGKKGKAKIIKSTSIKTSKQSLTIEL